MFKYFPLLAVLALASATNRAIVVLKADGVDGTITFTETDNGVVVEGTITGLTEGQHGFHIHEKGDLTKGCASTGAHFNPTNKTHGAPSDNVRHVGDLGNIVSNKDKVATVKITDKVISLGGANCILGRAVVVHSDRDDLGKGNQADSLTTGHAGARVACGIIGVLNYTENGVSLTSPYSLSILMGAALTISYFSTYKI